MIDSLKIHFNDTLELPLAASELLLMLFQTAQTFDDFADGDEVDRKDLNDLIMNTLVLIPLNPFYQKNQAVLIPAIMNCILKWQASDTVERSGHANAMSFAWRAGYYDIVLLVYSICFGYIEATKKAHIIMGLHGEKYDDYIKEGNDA